MKTDYAASCRFFSAEDACMMALQAYYAGCHHLQPPAGEPFLVDGQPWAGPLEFAEAFNGELQARLGLLALDRLGAFHAVSTVWDLHKLAQRVAPEKMAPVIAEFEAAMAEVNDEVLATESERFATRDNAADNGLNRGPDNGR